MAVKSAVKIEDAVFIDIDLWRLFLRQSSFCLENKQIGGDNEILINSRDIAEKFRKRHYSVLRTISEIIKKNPELSQYSFESLYLTKDGRHVKQFEIDDTGVDILNNRFKYNVRSARFEYKYLNEIIDFLDVMNISYVSQFPVDDYKIDLYIPQYNIAIEIDEEEHKYKKDYDSKRQSYIENQKHCKFIRINESESCGSVIAKLTKELELLCFRCA